MGLCDLVGAIDDGDIVDLLRQARKMDECCNLAAELVGIELRWCNYWTSRVLNIYEERETVDCTRRGFRIFI